MTKQEFESDDWIDGDVVLNYRGAGTWDPSYINVPARATSRHSSDCIDVVFHNGKERTFHYCYVELVRRNITPLPLPG